MATTLLHKNKSEAQSLHESLGRLFPALVNRASRKDEDMVISIAGKIVVISAKQLKRILDENAKLGRTVDDATVEEQILKDGKVQNA